MFVVRPAHPWWKTENWVNGRALPEGFRYASNLNKQWLTIAELKKMIGELHEEHSGVS
jgi:UDP-N-acetylglucosamine 4,6-dehydratase